MLPLRTDRLVLRPMRLDDAAVVVGYRSDPAVARYQDWPLPYTEAMFTSRFPADADRHPDFTSGTNLAIDLDGRQIGDVYARVGQGVGEVGWTLSPAAQGHGYATEAAAAVVQLLFTELGAHRLEASMHPDNLASARVCEAIGMTFEVHTRMNFPGRDGWEDDVRYSMQREDWEAWVQRPRHEPADVRLVPLTEGNLDDYGALATHHSQQRFVRPVVPALAQTAVPLTVRGLPYEATSFGIEADGEPAGFAQLATRGPFTDEPYLWRLLIDRRHQRRGIGRRALTLAADWARSQGAATLTVSFGSGPGSPGPLYLGFGFVPTGEDNEGEAMARLTL